MKPKDGSLFTSLEREALICGRCGYCRNSCPVYQVVGWESATPRGKISIARDVFSKRKKRAIPDEFVHRMTQCTLCGSCATICPTAIDTRKLWLELRKRIAQKGKSPPAYKSVHQNILANKNITRFNNDDRLEWAQDLDAEPAGLKLKAGAEICYFVGCVSAFYPQAAQIPLAITEILMRSGVDFTTLGGDEWCCGFPLLSMGFVDDAKEFIRHNVTQLKKLDIHTLLSGCASCYHIWKYDSLKELGDYTLEVLHATEYLERLVKNGEIQLRAMDEVVTYHDPCDLGRNSGIYDTPRDIIKSIPGIRLVELQHRRENSLCCGGGGNLQSVDPEGAAAIARRRIEEIQQTGATIVVSSCQQCEQMLSAAISDSNLKVRVMDVSQLVLEAMD